MASEYQLIAPLPGMTMQTVLRVEDQAFIPFDEANRDYQVFLQWCDDGNVADPPRGNTADPAPDPTA